METEKLPELKELKEALSEVARCARAMRGFLWFFGAIVLVWAITNVVASVYGLVSTARMEDMVQASQASFSSVLKTTETDIDRAERSVLGSARGAAPGVDSAAAEKYLRVYFLIQSADAASKQGNGGDARATYEVALERLKEIKEQHPDWRSDLVKYRVRYLTEKIEGIRKAARPPGAEAPPAR